MNQLTQHDMNELMRCFHAPPLEDATVHLEGYDKYPDDDKDISILIRPQEDNVITVIFEYLFDFFEVTEFLTALAEKYGALYLVQYERELGCEIFALEYQKFNGRLN